MIIVDTNILVDVLQNDSSWADWSVLQLVAQSQIHALMINPVIYAELSMMYESIEALDAAIASAQLQVDQLPHPALFLAGKAFVRYRHQGGTKQNVLSDFFIGAHAAVAGCAVLTRDPRRYRSYFPTVDLITPDKPGGYCVHEPEA
jgi:predicted nucleic acid-binding protein